MRESQEKFPMELQKSTEEKFIKETRERPGQTKKLIPREIVEGILGCQNKSLGEILQGIPEMIQEESLILEGIPEIRLKAIQG